jgi:hypothetical protein
MHLFGTLGTLMFIVGFLSAAWLGAKKIYFISIGVPADLVTKSPYFFLALTSMIIGTQLFLTGFLGEMISRSSSNRNTYLIERKNNI